jgi:hypothetical protein
MCESSTCISNQAAACSCQRHDAWHMDDSGPSHQMLLLQDHQDEAANFQSGVHHAGWLLKRFGHGHRATWKRLWVSAFTGSVLAAIYNYGTTDQPGYSTQLPPATRHGSLCDVASLCTVCLRLRKAGTQYVAGASTWCASPPTPC